MMRSSKLSLSKASMVGPGFGPRKGGRCLTIGPGIQPTSAGANSSGMLSGAFQLPLASSNSSAISTSELRRLFAFLARALGRRAYLSPSSRVRFLFIMAGIFSFTRHFNLCLPLCKDMKYAPDGAAGDFFFSMVFVPFFAAGLRTPEPDMRFTIELLDLPRDAQW